VAQQLIQAAIDAATALSGARQLHLSVNTQNKNALRLYLSTGFQIYGQDHGALLIDGVLHDEYLMQRPLMTAPATVAAPESATESVTAAAASGLPPEYRLLPAIPAAGTYLHLRQASGLSPKTMAAALRGLPHSQFAVQVLYQGEAVGMGRVIGDGGCFIRSQISACCPHTEVWASPNTSCKPSCITCTPACRTAHVSLIADGEANKLYSQFGFQMTAPKSVGMAMVIRKPA
jgi:hypothetical protein